MSLDVYLIGEEKEDYCGCCGSKFITEERLYGANITHNLNTMAEKAGIYKHLWRPEELGITKAKELIKPLQEGLKKLKRRPVYYSKFNAENGRGTYEHFVPFVEKYLNACIENPEAKISISR